MPFGHHRRFVYNFPYGNTAALNEEAQQTIKIFSINYCLCKLPQEKKEKNKYIYSAKQQNHISARVNVFWLVRWALKWNIFLFCVLPNIGRENNNDDDDNNNNDDKKREQSHQWQQQTPHTPKPVQTAHILTINIRSFIGAAISDISYDFRSNPHTFEWQFSLPPCLFLIAPLHHRKRNDAFIFKKKKKLYRKTSNVMKK